MENHSKKLAIISNDLCCKLIEIYRSNYEKTPSDLADSLYLELSQLQKKAEEEIDKQNNKSALNIDFINSINQLLNEKNTSEFRMYSVIPRKVYAGEIPSSIDDFLMENKIKKLNELGITSIINLTESNEKNFQGLRLKSYEEKLPTHIQMHRFEIKDLDIPSIELMKNIQKKIKALLDNNEVIYIHCWGGIGRTGTVIGCFLIEHEIILPENAIGLIQFLKRNTTIRDRNSPETIAQEEFIEKWTIN